MLNVLPACLPYRQPTPSIGSHLLARSARAWLEPKSRGLNRHRKRVESSTHRFGTHPHPFIVPPRHFYDHFYRFFAHFILNAQTPVFQLPSFLSFAFRDLFLSYHQGSVPQNHQKKNSGFPNISLGRILRPSANYKKRMSSQKNASSPNPASSKQRANMSTPTSSRRSPASNSSPAGSSASSSSSRRKPKQAASRSPPSHSQSQPEFLSFQPALQGCYDMPTPKSRRSPPRNASNGNLNAKYSNSYNGPMSSPIKPVTIMSLCRPAANSNRSSPTASAKRSVNKPFASAKYLELPMTANLPAPPADWLAASEVADEPEELLIAEPPSPTTAAAVALATEHGFDGRIRLSPLQLIAAVSAS